MKSTVRAVDFFVRFSRHIPLKYAYKDFNNLVGKRTAFYISHRLSSCKFCDHIAVFSGGTIKEYGDHDQLVNLKGGIYAEMFQAQAKYYAV